MVCQNTLLLYRRKKSILNYLNWRFIFYVNMTILLYMYIKLFYCGLHIYKIWLNSILKANNVCENSVYFRISYILPKCSTVSPDNDTDASSDRQSHTVAQATPPSNASLFVLRFWKPVTDHLMIRCFLIL